MAKWIDWRNSEAKKILLYELEKGYLTVHAEDLGPKEAWEKRYKHVDEFRDVSYEQFRDRLRDHRNQVKRLLKYSLDEQAGMVQDRKIFPRKSHNRKGEPVFDMDEAKRLLRDDVANGKHKEMTAEQLRNTRPSVYGRFSKRIFELRIHQEVRRNKFINYLKQQSDDDHMRQIEYYW